MLNRTALTAAVVLFAASASTPAFAQRSSPSSSQNTQNVVRVPKPTGEPKATPITSIMTAMLLAGGLVVLTLLPSKRGHQD